MIEVGNEVTIEGLNLTFYPDEETGSPQLVGFYKRNIELISTDNTIEPRVVEVANLTVVDLGSYVSINNLKVVSIYVSSDTEDYTITCEDSLGNEFGLHIQSSVSQTEIDEMFVIGSIINAIGPLGRYMGQYQLELSSLELVTKN